jgi:collagenase-like PrtC family protease
MSPVIKLVKAGSDTLKLPGRMHRRQALVAVFHTLVPK